MTKSALLAILGAVVVAAAIALNFFLDDVEEGESGFQHSPSTDKPPTVYTEPLPKKKLALKQAPTQTQQAYKPSFDIVRINPDGDTVIAGRATPGTKVEIFDDNKNIGEVLADRRGQWVFLPSAPLSPGSRRLSLKMIDESGDRVSSDKDVVLIVPEKGKDIAGRPSQEVTQPLALKVPKGDDGSIEILQKSTPVSADGQAIEFLVEAIDYNDLGKLNVYGKAPKRGLVQLYLNDRFIGRSSADGRGVWEYAPKDGVKPGVYTLRADHVNIGGKVLARREVVFARSVPLTGVKPGSLVVVEPGNSLWRIARRTYGSGFRYTVIYDANKEQIKNADLIFPGQVFALPSTN